MRSFSRADRVRQQLKREISAVLRDTVKGYDLTAVTITEVELSKDLKFAKVYFTVLGDEDQQQELAGVLQKVCPVIQAEAGARLGIRVVPKLEFILDRAVERGLRLGELFSQIEAEREDRQTEDPED